MYFHQWTFRMAWQSLYAGQNRPVGWLIYNVKFRQISGPTSCGNEWPNAKFRLHRQPRSFSWWGILISVFWRQNTLRYTGPRIKTFENTPKGKITKWPWRWEHKYTKVPYIWIGYREWEVIHSQGDSTGIYNDSTRNMPCDIRCYRINVPNIANKDMF